MQEALSHVQCKVTSHLRTYPRKALALSHDVPFLIQICFFCIVVSTLWHTVLTLPVFSVVKIQVVNYPSPKSLDETKALINIDRIPPAYRSVGCTVACTDVGLQSF